MTMTLILGMNLFMTIQMTIIIYDDNDDYDHDGYYMRVIMIMIILWILSFMKMTMIFTTLFCT